MAAVTDRDRHRRDNHWGTKNIDDDREHGHSEIEGKDPAEYIAFQLLSQLTQPICERHIDSPPWNGGWLAEAFAWLDGEAVDGRGEELHRENRIVELSDPELYLPKQIETEHGFVEYRQHRHRRRFNPETGYINWGESTSTGLPPVGYETYRTAAANYLASRDIRLTAVEEYVEMLDRYWHDQQLSSVESLEKFVAYVRKCESE